jgi:hypothetical protein
MKLEVLSDADDEGSIVVPVRRIHAPYFRRVARGAFRTRVGTSEQDETHKKCIDYLFGELSNQQFGLITYVFEGRNQDIFILKKPSRDFSYAWYKEARIPIGDGRYIQSDLCGRDVRTFSMGTKNPGVIIEVVQTHLPEREAFYALLESSRNNMFVGFYFISPGRKSSKFSSLYPKRNGIDLRFAYYMLDGVFYENGEPIQRAEGLTDQEWYERLLAEQFAYAMARKADSRNPAP